MPRVKTLSLIKTSKGFVEEIKVFSSHLKRHPSWFMIHLLWLSLAWQFKFFIAKFWTIVKIFDFLWFSTVFNSNFIYFLSKRMTSLQPDIAVVRLISEFYRCESEREKETDVTKKQFYITGKDTNLARAYDRHYAFSLYDDQIINHINEMLHYRVGNSCNWFKLTTNHSRYVFFTWLWKLILLCWTISTSSVVAYITLESIDIWWVSIDQSYLIWFNLFGFLLLGNRW